MKQFKYYIVGGFLAALSLSCSTKKNKFVNRNYHAITAQFNPIFHGYEALEEAKEELIEDYRLPDSALREGGELIIKTEKVAPSVFQR